MQEDYTPHLSSQARQSASSGCLPGFLLPPLAALFIGLLMASVLGGLSAQPQNAQQAIANVNENALALQATYQPIAPLFTPEVRYWAEHISAWALAAGIDPNLAATVMQIESCGDPQALSRAGAAGLFQVMPYHFLDGENSFYPHTNALRGLDYLARSLKQAVGNPRLALAGYNGGISVISRSEAEWANETQRYAYWGSGIYSDAQAGLSESGRLQEWLSAGGASLCQKARARLGISP